MAEETIALVLEIDGAADAGLGEEIARTVGAATRTLTKHGFDGDVASWLLVGNFVVSSLATIGPLLNKYLGDRRVKSIKVGDVTIENPRKEDVARILSELGARGDGSA